MLKFFWHVPVLLLLVSCTSPAFQDATTEFLAYIPQNKGTLLADFAPGYLVENPEKAFNRIGAPSAYQDENGELIMVDPARPVIYVEERKFTTEKDEYTNLIYRVPFQETPDDLIPFHLGAGKNVGNLLIITLNSLQQPVLYTTVQTCGCYLVFVPTSYLAKDSFPERWPKDLQTVYGETLPA